MPSQMVSKGGCTCSEQTNGYGDALQRDAEQMAVKVR